MGGVLVAQPHCMYMLCCNKIIIIKKKKSVFWSVWFLFDYMWVLVFSIFSVSLDNISLNLICSSSPQRIQLNYVRETMQIELKYMYYFVILFRCFIQTITVRLKHTTVRIRPYKYVCFKFQPKKVSYGRSILLHSSKVSRESDLRSAPYNRQVGVRSFVKKREIT